MIIRLKNAVPVFLAVIILIASIIVSMILTRQHSIYVSSNQTNSGPTSAESSYSSQTSSLASQNLSDNIHPNEMKALWVPYMSLDISSDFSEENFKQHFDTIVTKSKQFGFNALVVHIRPFADSLYPSEFFPWSHILTGTQGSDPGFDPLSYMVSKTHSQNMQFHAWINPLRIKSPSSSLALSDSNYYNIWKNDSDNLNDDYVSDFDGGLYFNPAYPQVHQVIVSGIKEIVTNYDVDGIQFDDYFYPTENESFDKIAYDNYKNNLTSDAVALDLLSFRINNINSLVMACYNAIKSVDNSVVFGISPQCNVENDLKMGADVYTWGSTTGYVDYLCPQLYLSLDNPALPFYQAADQWQSIVTNENVKLYYGLALYKAGSVDADMGTWQNSNTILKQQVEYGRSHNCDGFMFYSYDYLDVDQTRQEVKNLMDVLKL